MTSFMTFLAIELLRFLIATASPTLNGAFLSTFTIIAILYAGMFTFGLVISDTSIAFASIAMSFLATLYPARKAAKVKPAEVLRYE